MLDTIQAALHFTNGFVYFFKEDRYIKWEPGSGIVTLQGGRALGRLGVDDWTQLPAEFHSGIDAAFYYPPRDAVYFFKGTRYVKWKDGGPVAKNGGVLRTIGVDGWQTLPAEYAQGFDAVLYHEEREHAYFFKNSTYVKYKPGSGVVTANGSKVRQLGITGWTSLPLGFQSGVDAAMYYRANNKIYFFKGRQYVRWNREEGEEGVEPKYPRRIGLRNGLGHERWSLDMKHGWPGLSHVIAGPLIGHTTECETRVWVWLSDQESAEKIRIQLNGQPAAFTVVDPVSPALNASVQAVHDGSVIRQFLVKGLSPGLSHRLDLMLDGTLLESLQVRTPPSPSDRGDINLAFVSCIRITKEPLAAPALQALSELQPDLTLFCGDNCYYVGRDDDDGATAERGDARRPIDWSDTERMLRRQMQARNHPEMADLLLRGATFSTWDDHDFGFNNARGVDDEPEGDWVGRIPSSQVFRAVWPNDYCLEQNNIRHAFRWGPIHVFMPDSVFDSSDADHIIWGADQLDWLRDEMDSDAPLKIVVTSRQFLSTIGEEEHSEEADERTKFLAAIRNVSGRVLILSGDKHYTSLDRAREEDGELLEFTSSGAKLGNTGNGRVLSEPKRATRLWARRVDNFGLVRISINGIHDGRVIGQVIFEARDGNGQIIMDPVRHRLCRTTWDLDTGAIS